jgi:hypothetical protein
MHQDRQSIRAVLKTARIDKPIRRASSYTCPGSPVLALVAPDSEPVSLQHSDEHPLVTGSSEDGWNIPVLASFQKLTIRLERGYNSGQSVNTEHVAPFVFVVPDPLLI